MELHLEQVEPFRAAVREIGAPDPELTADLIAGMLHTALTAVEHGAPLDAVTDRALELVRRCLSPRRRRGPRPARGRPGLSGRPDHRPRPRRRLVTASPRPLSGGPSGADR
ncbi:hypothetical protein LUW77_01670 [Streptomyces radiopugnans]|nr:hypothetical protein LUW77_01670 [Streptomyces radiopugnans]